LRKNRTNEHSRWNQALNKDLLPTAWIAIGNILKSIDHAGGGVNSVIPFTEEVLALSENSELELSHPGSAAAMGIKGNTTAIRAGDRIRCNRCNGTQVYRGYKRQTWMPGCGAISTCTMCCTNNKQGL
jgi:hypothetical protein